MLPTARNYFKNEISDLYEHFCEYYRTLTSLARDILKKPKLEKPNFICECMKHM